MVPVFVSFTLPQAIFNKLLSFPFVGFLSSSLSSLGAFPAGGFIVARLTIACEASFDESGDNGTLRNARR